MTARGRYYQFQRHLAVASDAWEQVDVDHRRAWEGFNEELDEERRVAVEKAVLCRQESRSS